MKKLTYLLCLALLLSCTVGDEDFGTGGQENNTQEAGANLVLQPGVVVLTVDYTTNKFLGGYIIPLSTEGRTLDMACEYKSPSDFGSVRWYDKQSGKDIFSGTIVWMGTGKRTFPTDKDICQPGAFRALAISNILQIPVPLYHDQYDTYAEGVDYLNIWLKIATLECVHGVDSTTPYYIYLYRPSVGAGDSKDWYWVIFLKR